MSTMGLVNRLAKRYRNDGAGPYACTLCGATFDDSGVVICPKCRGLVRNRNA